MTKNVKGWVETITIPTYPIGEPDNKPHFLENRVYQGSSGTVYPYSVIDTIQDKKVDKDYIGIYIENDYIKVLILPELGGRIQTAYDKVAKRDFIYRNDVIKPALIGLTGPWISGGIEFNWPQHHRPTTFLPVDYNIIEDSNSVTVWLGEIEKMYGLRGIAGITLYENNSYIEINAKIYNGTNLPQTFLWWANSAVKANGGHQSIFPPDVYAVYDHGKRAVSDFPIATGTYYKADYSEGVDISKYDNVEALTSYMACKSKYDFMGAYVHEEKGGMLHIADHNISPGKKQFTWGNSEFGTAWSNNLTDENGPYVEVMTGVFADNQPDFTWINPYEEKIFTQYFMPYSNLGNIKNANKDLVLKADFSNNYKQLQLGVYATSTIQGIILKVFLNGEMFFTKTLNVSPKNTWLQTITTNLNHPKEINIGLYNDKNQCILEWEYEDLRQQEIPQPAQEPLKPHEVQHIDELIFIGQHIEQYHHATANAEEYYLEVLKRDNLNSRANLCLSRLNLRRGNFYKAKIYIEKSLKRGQKFNSNPVSGEAHFLKGLILEYLKNDNEAYESYYKSTWSGDYASMSFYNLARLSLKKQDYKQAEYFITNSLKTNNSNHKARFLNIFIKVALNDKDTALKLIEKYLAEDCLEFDILCEKYLISNDQADKTNFLKLSRKSEITFLDIARSYIGISCYDNAIKLLTLLDSADITDPMIYYYLAYCFKEKNNPAEYKKFIKLAENLENKGVFPNHIDDINVLKTIIKVDNKASNAMYLLGNLFYNKKQYETAIKLWEDSLNIKEYAITYRNLAMAYHNRPKLQEKAVEYMKKAVKLCPYDARLIFELNELYSDINLSLNERKEYLSKYKNLMNRRDDLLVEWIKIHNLTGNYNTAREIILNHNFHPWEGGEGKITNEYIINLQALAIQCINRQEYNRAIELLNSALSYPKNLGEGKLPHNTMNDTHYLLHIAYKHLNDDETAKQYLTKACYINDDLSDSNYYNDNTCYYYFFVGLAYKKQSNLKEAQKYFNKLINHAKTTINKDIKIDYFEVSFYNSLVFHTDLNIKNKIFCNFLFALGYWGLGEHERSDKYLKRVLKSDVNHNKANHFNNMILNIL